MKPRLITGRGMTVLRPGAHQTRSATGGNPGHGGAREVQPLKCLQPINLERYKGEDSKAVVQITCVAPGDPVSDIEQITVFQPVPKGADGSRKG